MSCIMALAMLASCLLVIPAGGVAATAGDYGITFNVTDSDGAPLGDADYDLLSVHWDGAIESGNTGPGGYAQIDAAPGYYELMVSHDGYYPNSVFVQFDGLESEYKVIPLETIVVDGTMNLTINGPASYDYMVIDAAHEHFIIASGTSSDANVEVDLPQGSYTLVASSEGNVTWSDEVTIGTFTNVTHTLDEGLTYNGYVTIADGVGVNNLSAYMVSKDTALSTYERVIPATTISNNYFFFDGLFAGEFYLIVDADGALMSIEDVTAPSSGPIMVDLGPQGEQTDLFGIEFSTWNAFTYMREAIRDYDDSFAGLPFNGLPMRMQIDFVFGNGDGDLNETEIAACYDWVDEFGPAFVNSDGILTVNGTGYVIDGEYDTYDFGAIVGAVNDTSQVEAFTTTEFTSIEGIDAAASTYNIALTSSMSSAYSNEFIGLEWGLYLTDGYEMTENETTTGAADVVGYTQVFVSYSDWIVEDRVNMVIEESVEPVVEATVVDGDNVFHFENDTTSYYLVGNGTEVTFSAAGTFDPNGNPLDYMWDFGDGSSTGYTSDVETTHTFTAPTYEGYDVTLTVRDKADLTNSTDLLVKVDGVVPEPVITADKALVSGELVIDQNEVVVLNTTGSADRIWDEVGYDGVIKEVNWDFGDGINVTVIYGEDQNVSHAWEAAGEYTLTLNATDGGGNYAVTTLTVDVKDITPPTASFIILNSTWDQTNTAEEGQVLYFDASASTDDHTATENLTFEWAFGDGNTTTGMNVSHTYDLIDSFTVYLNVSDEAGNWDNITKSVTITSGPRPDLRIVTVTFDPSRFVEGETGTIRTNVTNVGNANTTGGVTLTYYKINDDGTETEIGQKVVTDNIEVDGYLNVPWEYSFDKKGNYTIKVVASTDGEITTVDNEFVAYIDVDEATWKAAAIYGGIFAIIIVVIVLVYYRKRIPGLDRKKK